MAADDRSAYSAPALEKGLDILELLAVEPEPLTARQIGERLGRSKSEIFRMVYVLVERGYLLRDPATDRLSLSHHLFELGMRTPRSRTLLEAALPEMERLSEAVGHASHLVMVSHGQTVVVASAAPRSTPFNFALQLGYGNAATEAVSGQTIIAFQTPERRAAIIRDARRQSDGGILPDGLDAQLDAIAAAGSVVAASRYLIGVIDVCAPVLDRSGSALASIVVPCLQRVGQDEDYEAVRAGLVQACSAISGAIL
jgi:DNA-binding IclR family transcriptional regulator